MERYAIYYAPRTDEPLARFARAWLGRDPDSGQVVSQTSIDGVSSGRLAEITAEPRRYGFHGTLKPPFALAAGMTSAKLRTALSDFAQTQRTILVPALLLNTIDGFVALTPATPAPALDELAAACVRNFDAFRAPPSEEELAQRRKIGLTLRQDDFLRRWGYPYVMEEFRFHLTLTGRLEQAERDLVRGALERETENLRGPIAIRDLVLFNQERRDLPFYVAARFPLVG